METLTKVASTYLKSRQITVIPLHGYLVFILFGSPWDVTKVIETVYKEKKIFLTFVNTGGLCEVELCVHTSKYVSLWLFWCAEWSILVLPLAQVWVYVYVWKCVIVCVWHPCISVTPHWDHNEDKAHWSLLIQHHHSSHCLYPSLSFMPVRLASSSSGSLLTSCSYPAFT